MRTTATRLRETILAAVEPILALYQAVHIRYSPGVGGGAGCGCGCAWLAMTRMDSACYCPFPMQQVSINSMLGNRVWPFCRNPVALRGWIIGSPIRCLTEERYRRLVERSPDGICVHRNGRILYVNDAGVRLMLADSPEAITGRRITDLVSPESIRPMQAGVAALREVGDCSPRYQAQMIRTDGTLLAVEIV